jgi:hypothetical protein
MTLEIIIQFLSPMAGGLAAYVAVRSDLAALKARADAAEKRQDGAEREIGVLRERIYSLRGDL